jgi:hypothetical protein
MALARQAKANLHPLAFYTIEFTSPNQCIALTEAVAKSMFVQILLSRRLSAAGGMNEHVLHALRRQY